MSDFLADPFSLPPVPGLLRYCAPVLIHPRLHSELGGASTGVVWQAEASSARVFFGHEFRSFRPSLADLRLDYTNSFGRHTAREWLGEQGYPTNEDRAEVLAWSVESVRRGGKPLVGVATRWFPVRDAPDTEVLVWQRYLHGNNCVTLYTNGWRVENWAGHSSVRGPEFGDAGKAAADAALLALGWALTNADGSLTLPPLPEPTRG